MYSADRGMWNCLSVERLKSSREPSRGTRLCLLASGFSPSAIQLGNLLQYSKGLLLELER